jgi:hypothetical protein
MPHFLINAISGLCSWMPRTLGLYAVVTAIAAGILAAGLSTRSDLLKIVGVAVLFVWVPVGGPAFVWIGIQNRRKAALLAALAADRGGIRSAQMRGVFLIAEHRDGRRLELDCGGMLTRDAEAIAAYLNGCG